MGLYVSTSSMETPSPEKPQRVKRYRIVKGRTEREARALQSRGVAKKTVAASRKTDLNVECAWDEQRQLYSPRRLFAYWRRSHMLEHWQNTGDIKDHTDSYLLRLINLPEILLESYMRWRHAQTDDDCFITIPWDDLNRWLKRNGFTGKVSAGGDWSP